MLFLLVGQFICLNSQFFFRMAAVSNQHAHSESVKPMSSIENVISSSPVGASGSDTVHGCFGKYKI
jgi:hypothetical protein